MPLNLSSGPRPSKLTKEQRREAEAAIYGLPSQTPVMAEQLSAAEIERMRQIVAQHDNSQHTGLKQFDINNPPREPYRHQEFPKVVYHHEERKHRVVQNKEHEADVIEQGWSTAPYPAEVPEPELSAAEAAEAAAVDKKIAEAKRKPKPKFEAEG